MKRINRTDIVIGIFLAFILILIPASNADIVFNGTEVIAINNSCVDCHKTLSPSADTQNFNKVVVEHLGRGVSCSLECHENTVRKTAVSNYQQWSLSVHALKGVTCNNCHGGDPKQQDKNKAHEGVKNSTDINSSIYYTNVANTCGKCHSNELANFQSSKHYQRLEALELAPTCTTCHSPHLFSVLKPDQFGNLCGNCHSVYTKVAPYDVPIHAEYLLSKANKLKLDLQTTQHDIFWAKQNGTDVAQAEQLTDSALQTVQNLPPMWHQFNLTYFESEVNSSNDQVVKAEGLLNQNHSNASDTETVTATPTASKVTPGFEGVILFASLLAVYLIKRRN